MATDGAKVSNSSHVSGGCHGFRCTNGRLVPLHPKTCRPHAYRLPELLNIIHAIEKASLGAAGRTVRCARCKNNWFARAHTSRCRKWQPPRTRTHSQASFGLTNERKQ
ncbi:MAG: MJ0042-type zinc finger domain-containing protein [Pseudolabrys sp.]